MHAMFTCQRSCFHMVPMCEAPAPSTSSSATPAVVPAPVQVVSADVALDRAGDQYSIVRRDAAMAFWEQQLVAFQSQEGKRFVFTCCLPVDCVHTLGWFFADPSARAPPDDIHDAETVPDDYANANVESTAVSAPLVMLISIASQSFRLHLQGGSDHCGAP